MSDLRAAWRALAVLTLARMTMGVQFQSVPTLGEPLSAAVGLGPVALGWLTGLYLLPGIVLAFAGGWLGTRYGDLRLVRAGLAMMAVGAAAMLFFAPVPEFAGRLLAGSGAILLNVLVTKIVADTFPPERLPTAMGILISSWPIGLAAALAVLPAVELAFGLRAAMALPVILALVCFGILRTESRSAGPVERQKTVWPDGRGWALVVLAGGVWAFYNVALIVLLAFGPTVVAAQGVGAVEAAAYVSALGWALVPGLILGGWIASRIGNPDVTMMVSFALIAVASSLIWTLGAELWVWILIGLLFGPPGGLIMALPARAIEGPARAIGFGVYFTVYYVVMPLGPPVAAFVLAATGAPGSAVWVTIATLAITVLCLIGFLMVLPRRSPASNEAVGKPDG